MKTEKINVSEIYGLEGCAELSACIMDSCFDNPDEKCIRPAVIIVPGGAYRFVSVREGEPVAAYFLSKGYQTFVLNYSVYPYGYPTQLNQLACAVDYVKRNADKYAIDVSAVYAVGFSAGGHLVGNLAVDYAAAGKLSGKNLDCRPAAAALCYPVISSRFKYQESHSALLNKYSEDEKAELLKKLNLDDSVTRDTVPCFIWTTAEDTVVPAQNAIAFAMALAEKGVRYELHIFPDGDHGLSTAAEPLFRPSAVLDRIHGWLDLCAEFFCSTRG